MAHAWMCERRSKAMVVPKYLAAGYKALERPRLGAFATPYLISFFVFVVSAAV